MNEYKKNQDGSYSIIRSGKITDVIRKDRRSGYNKFVITASGVEFLPPCFSHFTTLKAALAFCNCKK